MRSESAKLVARSVIPPNLPMPRPDELLYSLVARSAIYIGLWSPKQLMETIYRSRKTLAIPDLPSSLGRLAGIAEAWGMTIEGLANQHTLLPYYTHFLPTAERRRVVEAMMRRQEYLHVRLGICAGIAARIAYFRLCPSCTREDIAEHGETYWRRVHHLPGVVVCAHHREVLLETKVPFRPIGRHEHVRAHQQLLVDAVPLVADVGSWDIAHAIAHRSAALLLPTDEPMQTDYRPVFRRLGFVGKRGGSARLKSVVREVIPPPLLQAMFSSRTADENLAWIDVARRKPRRALHPLKHVILQVFLDVLSKKRAGDSLSPAPAVKHARTTTSKAVFRRQAVALAAHGYSTRAIARRLGIAWKTAARLLEPPYSKPPDSRATTKVEADRAVWAALHAAAPTATRTQLRRSAPALYARLYRADRTWLMAQSCPRYPRLPVTRVDWEARDRVLADRVATKVEDLRTRTPPIRASRHRVLGELQIRTVIAMRGTHLPKTQAILAEHCETVEAFQLRRLTLVLDAQQSNSRVMGDSALLRAARINPDRFPDHGVALLTAARVACQ